MKLRKTHPTAADMDRDVIKLHRIPVGDQDIIIISNTRMNIIAA
jgi:hypothetical protein